MIKTTKKAKVNKLKKGTTKLSTKKIFKKSTTKAKAKVGLNQKGGDHLQRNTGNSRDFPVRTISIPGRRIDFKMNLREIALKDLKCSLSEIAVGAGLSTNALYYLSRIDNYREPKLTLILKILGSINKIALSRKISKIYTLANLFSVEESPEFQ